MAIDTKTMNIYTYWNLTTDIHPTQHSKVGYTVSLKNCKSSAKYLATFFLTSKFMTNANDKLMYLNNEYSSLVNLYHSAMPYAMFFSYSLHGYATASLENFKIYGSPLSFLLLTIVSLCKGMSLAHKAAVVIFHHVLAQGERYLKVKKGITIVWKGH